MTPWDFNPAFDLTRRLAFWDHHPLIGTIPIALPCIHRPFVMYCQNDDTVVKTLYWAGFFGGWEPTSLRVWGALASESMVVFDVGAYTGIYGLLAAAASTNATSKVYCFEGSKANFERLAQNIALNNIQDRVRGIQSVVSHTDGTMTFYERYAAPNILSSVHSLTSLSGIPVQVPSITLDSFVELYSHANPDLIKIDVEGAEQDVLRGSSKMFQSSAPTILMEANSLEELARSWALFPYSYRCFAIDESEGRLFELSRSAIAVPHHVNNRNFLFTARHSVSDIERLQNNWR